METPPHPWGKQHCSSITRFVRGNTPTPVGKTNQCFTGFPEREKHPSTRGANALVIIGVLLWVETPPHPWGKLQHPVAQQSIPHKWWCAPEGAVADLQVKPCCLHATRTVKNPAKANTCLHGPFRRIAPKHQVREGVYSRLLPCQ